MPILGLVWQESMCAVAAMSRKTNVKSDFNGEKMCNSIPNTQVEYKLCQKVLAQNTTTTSFCHCVMSHPMNGWHQNDIANCLSIRCCRGWSKARCNCNSGEGSPGEIHKLRSIQLLLILICIFRLFFSFSTALSCLSPVFDLSEVAKLGNFTIYPFCHLHAVVY